MLSVVEKLLKFNILLVLGPLEGVPDGKKLVIYTVSQYKLKTIKESRNLTLIL